jgi:hypothetical protein
MENYELDEDTEIQSGLDVISPDYDNFKLIRSISLNSLGKINIVPAIKEIFEGIIFGNTEYVAHPSTIIVDGLNVIIASQIYDKYYDDNVSSYEGIRTYDEFFIKRSEIIDEIKRSDPTASTITWLGAPSFVFNYRTRNLFKTMLGTSCNYMMFWLASFASTNCVKNSQLSGNSCKKLIKLKKTCLDERKYRTHKTFSDFFDNKTKHKFITNFEEALESITQEFESIQNYNDENHTEYYQRYNELLSVYFPWDIEGIEVGNVSRETLEELISNIETYRNVYLQYYEELRVRSDLIEFVQSQNLLYNNEDEKQELNRRDPIMYILLKFLNICVCEKSLLVYDELLIEILNIIILSLHTPLKFYQYVVSNDNRNCNIELLENHERTKPFVLFTQKKDHDSKIIFVKIAEQQLINSEMAYGLKEVGFKRRSNRRSKRRSKHKSKHRSKRRSNRKTKHNF